MTGDVVAILSGSQAGQWRLIAQGTSPTQYLLDSPLPSKGQPSHRDHPGLDQ